MRADSLSRAEKGQIKEELGGVINTLIRGCEALDMDMAFSLFSDSPGFLMNCQKTNRISTSLLVFVCLILLLAACSPQVAPLSEQLVSTLNEQQAADIAWQALEPNTSSHNQAAWEIVGVEMVTGREVQDLFEGEPVPGGCAPGPAPPDNGTIALSGSYWHVEMKPRLATPRPQPTEQFSPTAPPSVPEPFVYGAHLLIDVSTGQVVARKLYCVIY